MVAAIQGRLRDYVEPTEGGRAQLTISLPNTAAIDQLASTLARLQATGQPPPQ